MATQIGSLVILKLGGLLLTGETSVSVSSAQTMIETSSKVSGNDATFASGRITRTMSVSSVGTTDPTTATYGYKAALEAQEAGTLVAFILTEYTTAAATTPVTGMTKLTGNAYISNVSIEVPDNDKQTFSLDLQITGELAVATN